MKRPIFGRTDLRKAISEAKFDPEADFDVKKIKNRPKIDRKSRKTEKKSRKFFRKKFFGVKKSKVANRPKRVFPKFRGDGTRRVASRRVATRRTSVSEGVV